MDNKTKKLMFLLSPFRKNTIFFVFMFLLGALCIIVDPSVNKTITFFELFLDVYILSTLLSFLPDKIRRIANGVFYVLFYSLAIVDIFLIYRLGAPITPTFIQMVMETDQSEATEALASYITWDCVLSPVLLVFVLIAAHIYCAYKCKLKYNGNLPCLTSLIVFTLIIIGIIVSFRPKKFMAMMYAGNHKTFMNLQGMGYYKPENIYYIPIYKLLYSIKENTYGKEEIAALKSHLNDFTIDSCSYDTPNLILIIGESHNKHHSQIYGYNKPTTPFQTEEQEKGRLVAFTDVVTSYNATTESFKNMFSMYAYGEKGDWCDYPLFPVVFKKAGYHTAFITNQFTQDLNSNFSDFDAGMFFNNKDLSQAQFDVRNINRHEFDEALLADYDSLKQYNGKYNLLIFHLRGQHVKYHMRYPAKWNKFKPSDYHRPDLSNADLQVLAAYDNATLYNDYIFKEIVKRFADKDAVVVYVSDHGEDVFDGCQTFGRPMVFDANNLFQQFQIPFIVYMTDVYQQKHPQMVAQIRSAMNKPFMTDNLSQLLLGLAGIKMKYYKPTSDPLNPTYQVSRKRKIRGEYDYDTIMKGYNLQVKN